MGMATTADSTPLDYCMAQYDTCVVSVNRLECFGLCCQKKSDPATHSESSLPKAIAARNVSRIAHREESLHEACPV
jgi:hypothetical protein